MNSGFVKRIASLVAAVLLVSCATNVIMVSREKLDPYAGKVVLYHTESEAPIGYKVIAAIHYYDWGKYRRLTIVEAIPDLEEKARAIGANGVIIDSSETIYSGFFSRGIDVKARAILVK